MYGVFSNGTACVKLYLTDYQFPFMTNEQQMKEVTIHKNCYDLRFIGISILNTN